MTFEIHWAALCNTPRLAEMFAPDRKVAQLFYEMGVFDTVQNLQSTIDVIRERAHNNDSPTITNSKGIQDDSNSNSNQRPSTSSQGTPSGETHEGGNG